MIPKYQNNSRINPIKLWRWNVYNEASIHRPASRADIITPFKAMEFNAISWSVDIWLIIGWFVPLVEGDDAMCQRSRNERFTLSCRTRLACCRTRKSLFFSFSLFLFFSFFSLPPPFFVSLFRTFFLSPLHLLVHLLLYLLYLIHLSLFSFSVLLCRLFIRFASSLPCSIFIPLSLSCLILLWWYWFVIQFRCSCRQSYESWLYSVIGFYQLWLPENGERVYHICYGMLSFLFSNRVWRAEFNLMEVVWIQLNSISYLEPFSTVWSGNLLWYLT